VFWNYSVNVIPTWSSFVSFRWDSSAALCFRLGSAEAPKPSLNGPDDQSFLLLDGNMCSCIIVSPGLIR
jgi:hypothetical protein